MLLLSQVSTVNQYHQQDLLCLLIFCVYSMIRWAVMTARKVIKVNLNEVWAIVCGMNDVYRSSPNSGIQIPRKCAFMFLGTSLVIAQRPGVNCFGNLGVSIPNSDVLD